MCYPGFGNFQSENTPFLVLSDHLWGVGFLFFSSPLSLLSDVFPGSSHSPIISSQSVPDDFLAHL